MVIKNLLFVVALYFTFDEIHARIESRIVGGLEGLISDCPYQVSMTSYDYYTEKREHICGGSLIKSNVVLTAAHCSHGFPPRKLAELEFRVGSTSSTSGGKLYRVVKVIEHEDYNGITYENDIALMFLNESVVESKDVRIIKIASKHPAPGTLAKASGWGYLVANGLVNSEKLRYVDLPLIDDKTCQETYYPDEELSESMMCAGYPEGGKDTCTNDSGGPLVVNGEVIGIVSWGTGCGAANRPGIYTKVFMMRDWIIKNCK